MNKPQIQRRDFLKTAGGLLLAAVFIPLGRFLKIIPKPAQENHNTSLKEAKHYTSGDNLAG